MGSCLPDLPHPPLRKCPIDFLLPALSQTEPTVIERVQLYSAGPSPELCCQEGYLYFFLLPVMGILYALKSQCRDTRCFLLLHSPVTLTAFRFLQHPWKNIYSNPAAITGLNSDEVFCLISSLLV